MQAADLSFGDPSGIQPSPSRAQRSSAAGADPPKLTGTGAVGRGRMLASSIWWNSPSKLKASSVHRRFMNTTCSSRRAPLRSNPAPSASYSTLFQPMPTPSRKRLSDRIATSAACLAASAA